MCVQDEMASSLASVRHGIAMFGDTGMGRRLQTAAMAHLWQYSASMHPSTAAQSLDLLCLLPINFCATALAEIVYVFDNLDDNLDRPIPTLYLP